MDMKQLAKELEALKATIGKIEALVGGGEQAPEMQDPEMEDVQVEEEPKADVAGKKAMVIAMLKKKQA